MSFVVSLTGSNLSYEFSDGTILFQDLHFSFGQKTYGLVGPNGIGKTTFLKLLSGELKPTQGSLLLRGSLEVLPQIHQRIFITTNSKTISEELGIQQTVKALKEMEGGDTSLETIEAVGENWDLESRIRQIFCSLGIEYLGLQNPVSHLSGGELVKVSLAKILLKSPSIVLLDEPTNNLDQAGRDALYDFIKSWKQSMVIVSHDRTLLSHVHTITELTNQGLQFYGGNYEFYRTGRENEILALNQQIITAQQEKQMQKADLQRSMERQKKRMVQGKRKAAEGGIPKILANGLKRKAQSTLARVKDTQESRLLKAAQDVRDLRNKVKQRNLIQIDIPATNVPPKKEIVEIKNFNFKYAGAPYFLFSQSITFHLAGPKRVRLKGPNGVGKSTLIRLLLQTVDEAKNSPQGECRGVVQLKTSRVAYLDQNLEILGEGTDSLLELFSRMTPHLSETERRIRLGRFLFQQNTVSKKISSLSGGERVRAALASILFSENPPELLILDEPTNNLDLDSIEQVESALSNFKGAIIAISHDSKFLTNIGTTDELNISVRGSPIQNNGGNEV